MAVVSIQAAASYSLDETGVFSGSSPPPSYAEARAFVVWTAHRAFGVVEEDEPCKSR
jgi:hypothetical protein